MFWASAEIRSGSPVWLSVSAPTTVMGAALSAAVRPVTRVPVTMTDSSPPWLCAIAGAAAAIAMAIADCASSRTFRRE